ncbi:MAG: hypothetical protein E6J00_12720 [Chloroflexi bacterium]|nr:MAG: hypothetical protein E6J00_12720 [Chloroflexota bacterium]
MHWLVIASSRTPLLADVWHRQFHGCSFTTTWRRGRSSWFTRVPGQRTTAIDARNDSTSYGYDAAGRLTSITDAPGRQDQPSTRPGRRRRALPGSTR